MKNQEENRVVDLRTRRESRRRSEPIGELLALTRSISLKFLGDTIGYVFEEADDALFDHAEAAGSNADQSAYMDSLRELRRKRGTIERGISERIARAFSEFREKRQAAERNPDAREDDYDRNNLSLVDDQELEQSLAITSMVTKGLNRYSEDLHALNKRFSVLIGGASVSSDTNPIGPAVLCDAFRESMEGVGIDVNSLLITYKLFDRCVMDELGLLYSDVNRTLAEAGVLPSIRTPIRRSRYASHAGRKRGRGTAPDSEQSTPGHERGSDADIVGEIRHLLSQSYGPSSQGTGAGSAAYFAQIDLLNALAVLQQQFMQSAQQIAPADPSQLKSQLTEQVQSISDSARGRQIGRPDEETVDLVGMVFEYIVNDRNLPDSIQLALSRLQLPYIKVALLDDRFFSQRNHPARELLDGMARAGIGWTPENDRDDKLINMIRQTVDRVLEEFRDNTALFEELLSDFKEFMAGYQRVAQVAEKRAAEATRGREKLHASRKRVAREIISRLDENKVPDPIRDLLVRPWANALVLILLRYGEDSEEWQRGLQTADDMIWMVQPKPDEAARQNLMDLFEPVTKSLQEGLTMVALHEDRIEAILEDLATCCDAVMNSEPPEVVKSRNNGPTGNDTRHWMSPEFAFEDQEDGAAVEIPEQHLAAAENLEPGTWMEFRDADGNIERAKLSWISPISQRYLFVNQRGIKVADHGIEELATLLQDGKVAVLDADPLFDRALEAIASKLRGNSGQEEAPSPA